jgi:hypothetical protein
MVLRSHVVEVAGVRSSERRRAWANSSKRRRQRAGRRAASESTVVDALLATGTHVPLNRRLRRAVAVWPEEPGLTPAPALLRRRHLLLHGHAPPRPAPPRSAPPRAAPPRAAPPPCAAPPAPSLRSAACATPPAPCRFCRAACAAPPAPCRLTPRRRARLRLARLRLAPRRPRP